MTLQLLLLLAMKEQTILVNLQLRIVILFTLIVILFTLIKMFIFILKCHPSIHKDPSLYILGFLYIVNLYLFTNQYANIILIHLLQEILILMCQIPRMRYLAQMSANLCHHKLVDTCFYTSNTQYIFLCRFTVPLRTLLFMTQLYNLYFFCHSHTCTSQEEDYFGEPMLCGLQ